MTEPRETISVDVLFRGARPGFGDLFSICGTVHPNFPPEGAIDFAQFEDLMVSQIDDWFGVATISGEGADVAVWVFPLVSNHIVDHHPGPFDGLRLEYDVLRNPTHRLAHFLKMLDSLATRLPADLHFESVPSDFARIRQDAEDAIASWRRLGLEPGSPEAMARDT